jgi:hypothetical protein
LYVKAEAIPDRYTYDLYQLKEIAGTPEQILISTPLNLLFELLEPFLVLM